MIFNILMKENKILFDFVRDYTKAIKDENTGKLYPIYNLFSIIDESKYKGDIVVAGIYRHPKLMVFKNSYLHIIYGCKMYIKQMRAILEENTYRKKKDKGKEYGMMLCL